MRKTTAILVLLASCSRAYDAGSVRFAPPKVVVGAQPPGLAQPFSAVAADFNGDGIPDLAVPNVTGGDASIFLSKGDGTFLPPIHAPIGGSPAYLVAADFDGDGNVDLIAQNGRFIPGRGDGTFGPAQVVTTILCCEAPLEEIFNFVTAGDFNGDGRMDVAFADRSNGVTVFFGRGDGTFSNGPQMQAGAVTGLAAADMNRDGRPDLVVILSNGPSHRSAITVLLSLVGGTFRQVTTAVDFTAGWPAVADFNGDGIPDVASGVTLLLGNGDGTFRTSTFRAPVSGIAVPGWGIAAADLDGDGVVDLAVANYSQVVTLRGHGDGSMVAANSYPAGTLPQFVAIADFNRDGRPDLAVVNLYSETVSILLSTGGGSFQAAQTIGGGRVFSQLIAADFNGDGLRDLAAVDWTNAVVSVSMNLGGGEFGPSADSSLGFRAPLFSDVSAATADFNGDGKQDLAILTSSGVSVMLGRGDGTFAHAGIFPAGVVATGTLPRQIAAADFNGDGIPDLIVASDGTVILEGKGDGTFGAPVNVSPLGGALAVGDLNGDGRADFALPWDVNAVVYLANPDGGFTYYINPVKWRPVGLAIADVNGDGKPDLISVPGFVSDFDHSELPGPVSTLLGNGDGSFQKPVESATCYYYRIQAVADFNGDGMADLLEVDAVEIFATGTAHLLMGHGDGTFEPGPEFAVELGILGITAADFDGDGMPDLAIALAPGKVVLLRNITRTSVSFVTTHQDPVTDAYDSPKEATSGSGRVGEDRNPVDRFSL